MLPDPTQPNLLMNASSLRPLRKKKLDGTPYTRVGKTNIKLEELLRLPESEVLAHCAVPVKEATEYVPSECLLYLVRIKYGSSPKVTEHLFHLLSERILRRLPSRVSSEVKPVSLKNSSITDEVYGNFIAMVSQDRHEYIERLDFFEIRFDAAFATLRFDAREKAWRHENRSVALEVDPETGELPEELEKRMGSTEPFDIKQLERADYRSGLDAAIDSLPSFQSKIITLLRRGMKIESQDPTEMTIVKALHKSSTPS